MPLMTAPLTLPPGYTSRPLTPDDAHAVYEVMAAQEKLKDEVVDASAGGGMVTVKITGDLELREVIIDPQAVDPEDVELLQDMVLAATNEAIRAAQELAATRMNAVAGPLAGGLGGLGLPGM